MVLDMLFDDFLLLSINIHDAFCILLDCTRKSALALMFAYFISQWYCFLKQFKIDLFSLVGWCLKLISHSSNFIRKLMGGSVAVFFNPKFTSLPGKAALKRIAKQFI